MTLSRLLSTRLVFPSENWHPRAMLLIRTAPEQRHALQMEKGIASLRRSSSSKLRRDYFLPKRTVRLSWTMKVIFPWKRTFWTCTMKFVFLDEKSFPQSTDCYGGIVFGTHLQRKAVNEWNSVQGWMLEEMSTTFSPGPSVWRRLLAWARSCSCSLRCLRSGSRARKPCYFHLCQLKTSQEWMEVTDEDGEADTKWTWGQEFGEKKGRWRFQPDRVSSQKWTPTCDFSASAADILLALFKPLLLDVFFLSLQQALWPKLKIVIFCKTRKWGHVLNA